MAKTTLMLRPDACPRSKPGVLCKDLGDEFLFYDTDREMVHVLNATAREIYRMCDGNLSVSELVRVFLERYEVDDQTARQDIAETLDRLLEIGLIKLA